MPTTADTLLENAAAVDIRLVAEALSGSESSFEALVQKYQRPIVAYVFRMLGDYDASLDVTQEVFIKVYNSLDKYSSEYKFTTWLYRIAHNAAIDHVRRHSTNLQSIETESPDGTYELQIESPLPSPEKQRSKASGETEIEAVIADAFRQLIET